MRTDELTALIAAARGETPVDLLLKNARVINVFNGDIETTDVAVHRGYVAGFGLYDARETVDLAGAYLTPGLIDAHVHPESGMLEPGRWAEELLPLGTTGVVADPHEIANVLGLEGIRFILERSENLPLHVVINLPSCVPATHLETSGANLSAQDISPLFDHPRVAGLAEMMNFPGVLFRFDPVLRKLALAQERSMPIDGHAPGVAGRDLSAYLAAGIGTDHECFSAAEAEEKLKRGMVIIIREGSAARNLKDLLPVVNERTSWRCMFCTDDRHALDLGQRGHLNSILRDAVALGLDPVTAVRMATITPALHYRLIRRGAIAPGYHADLAAFNDLTDFRPVAVWSDGVLAARDGKACFTVPPWNRPWPNVMNLPPLKASAFVMDAEGERGPVIEILPGQIVTGRSEETLARADGHVVADVSRDLLKLVVVERYSGQGGRAAALARGFGITRGALASSVAHDSHNIIAVGVDDNAIAAAVNELRRNGGGLVALDADGTVALPLPAAGLMSNLSGDEVRQRLAALMRKAAAMGCVLDEPFMQLAFLALPVIPALKLTDKGLVDVDRFDFLPFYRLNEG